MLRRDALRLLLGSFAGTKTAAASDLGDLLAPKIGAAILIDVRSRRLIASNGSVCGTILAPPGSTLKPFVLAALLQHGTLQAATAFQCPGRLAIGNRRFDCAHPRLGTPLHVDTALAYSCNCFVAKMAERFQPGELARDLTGVGFAARSGLMGDAEISGRVEAVESLDGRRLQSLGEAAVLITPAEMALAYRQLALKIGSPEMQPILDGLEGAVDFGTAQNARVAGIKVAGKTGSTRNAAGSFIAWFAGFMPSRAPEVVVTVMMTGRSGGSDAAPVAAQILESYRAGRFS